jgi:hypothetical protein
MQSVLQHNYIYILILWIDFPRKGRQPGFEICYKSNSPTVALSAKVCGPPQKEEIFHFSITWKNRYFVYISRQKVRQASAVGQERNQSHLSESNKQHFIHKQKSVAYL